MRCFQAEGELDFKSIMYIPAKPPQNLWVGGQEGLSYVKLFVKRYDPPLWQGPKGRLGVRRLTLPLELPAVRARIPAALPSVCSSRTTCRTCSRGTSSLSRASSIRMTCR